MKKILFFILLFLPITVKADNYLLNEKCNITIADKTYSKIEDDSYASFLSFSKDDELKITCEETFKNIYIMYNVKSSKATLKYNDVTITTGTNEYLNEVIKLDKFTNEATLIYDEDYSIAEIYVFGDKIPDWVQDWQTLEKADLMLFSTHADDEQLFFAGLMPTYIDKGYEIQVIYFTNHYNNTLRYHEQLEGLWTIGIKYYPVISTFPDAYSTSLEGATANLNAAGYTVDDALAFEVEQIRRFKPYVVVGHDEKGEYSHGQHILNTDVLKKAIHSAADKDYLLDNDYDPWQTNKLYLHLYEQNPIILNYDVPLDSYNGKTAYAVAKEGYSKHYSQQYTWFTDWLNGPNNSYTSATQIKTYNPAYYGLYYTNVGEDVTKDDMFENIKFPISEIIFNNTSDNSLEKFKNTVSGLTTKEKYMYLGISIMLISGIGLIIIKRRRK